MAKKKTSDIHSFLYSVRRSFVSSPDDFKKRYELALTAFGVSSAEEVERSKRVAFLRALNNASL